MSVLLSLCKESQKLQQLHSASHWELVTCGLVNIWMRPTEAVLSAFLISLHSHPPTISLAGFLRVLEKEELGRIFN